MSKTKERKKARRLRQKQQPQGIRCISCGRRNSVQSVGDELLKCGACGVIFDSAPDEGGDYSDRNPAARLEREDRARAKRAQPRRA